MLLSNIEKELECSFERISTWAKRESNAIQRSLDKYDNMKPDCMYHSKWVDMNYPKNIFMELYHDYDLKYTKVIVAKIEEILADASPIEAVSILKMRYKYKLSYNTMSDILDVRMYILGIIIFDSLECIRCILKNHYESFIDCSDAYIFTPPLMHYRKFGSRIPTGVMNHTYPKNVYMCIYDECTYDCYLGEQLSVFIDTKLSKLHRQVIIDRFLYKKTYKEIAENAGISVSYVSKRIKDILKIIRHNWTYFRLSSREKYYDITIDELDVSVETFLKLNTNHVYTIEDILQLTYDNLYIDFGLDATEIKSLVTYIENLGFSTTCHYNKLKNMI